MYRKGPPDVSDIRRKILAPMPPFTRVTTPTVPIAPFRGSGVAAVLLLMMMRFFLPARPRDAIQEDRLYATLPFRVSFAAVPLCLVSGANLILGF